MPMQIILSDEDTQMVTRLVDKQDWAGLPRWELLGIISDLIESMNRGIFNAQFGPRLSPGVDRAEVPTIHNHPSHDRTSCPICHVAGHSELECGLW